MPPTADNNFPAANVSWRDWLAALAMQAMLSRDQYGQVDLAQAAYTYADAMLDAAKAD